MFSDVNPGEKVLFIDFVPENIPADRVKDAIIADHHSPGQQGKTATEEVARLAAEGRLQGVTKVVGNHWDTDRVMAEAIARNIITVKGEAAMAMFAARAGDHLVGDDKAMRINWAIMGMIHGDRGGKFEKVPVEKIVLLVPELIQNPDSFEMYYKGTADFMDASREAVRTGSVEVRDRIGIISTERYAHPMAGYEAIRDRGASVMIKQSPHPKGGYSYDIGIVPSVEMAYQYNLSDTFSALKIMESQTSNPNFNPNDNWGCDPARAGGSPRGYGSTLTIDQVSSALVSNLHRYSLRNSTPASSVDAALGTVDAAELERLATEARTPKGAIEKAGREAEKARSKGGKERERL